MIRKIFNITAFLIGLSPSHSIAQTENDHSGLDVQSYHVQLEPELLSQFLKGNVIVQFSSTQAVREVAFDCGDLSVDHIKGPSVKGFRQEGKKLVVLFTKPIKAKQKIQIFYHGSPSKGIVFSPETQEMYTLFFSSEWMVCNDQPHDKASINIDLIIPAGLKSIANGSLTEQKEVADQKLMHSWRQKAATPSYTFGFALGSFNHLSNEQQGRTFNYYSGSHSADELSSIFKPSPDMLRFFERKSGMPYFQHTYAQVLVGNHFQEMAGFAVLKKTYGKMVLKDSTETNLIGHELAHQWWGNMITCENFGHFWLNEAFATYMSAAYNEYRFGREKYMENIQAYYKVYEKTKAKGADKPLVFEDWSNPTADDRNLVYFKGAYVLHLLRTALGDDAFWKGIKYYSQQYYGRTVVTQDFQKAMEQSTQRDLTQFFEEWVYQ